jgi:hypothetical protein
MRANQYHANIELAFFDLGDLETGRGLGRGFGDCRSCRFSRSLRFSRFSGGYWLSGFGRLRRHTTSRGDHHKR